MIAKPKNSNKAINIRIAIVVAIPLILFDLTPFGGNLRFYAKWLECGNRPVQVASWNGIAWYEQSPIFSVPRTQVWYCTPIEAERAGYSASQNNWDFPNLVKAGEPSPFLKH